MSINLLKRRDFLGILSKSFVILASRNAFSLPASSRITPEMFGAVADGKTDCSGAFQKALADGRPVDLGVGTYLVKSTIFASRKSSKDSVEIVGVGTEKSKILLANFTPGLQVIGNPTTLTRVTLKNFTVFRKNAENYKGPIVGHNVYVTNGNNVLISGIEEYGAVGMGILLKSCANYEVTGCYVHDHCSGAVHKSGTDGIHLYMCQGPGKIHDNRVVNVGDDGISFGSFDPNHPTKDVSCHSNVIKQISGSIKVYGNSSSILIQNNDLDQCKNGGVMIWDDRDKNHSFNITNVKILNNTITNSGGPGGAGGISLMQTRGNGVQEFRDVTIAGNTITGCTNGITIDSAVLTKITRRLSILANTINNSKSAGIYINGITEAASITDNIITNSQTSGIFFNKSIRTGTYTIAKNKITDFCLLRINTEVSRNSGIRINEADQRHFKISKNIISNLGQSFKAWAIQYKTGFTNSSTILNNNNIDLTSTKGVR